MYWLKRELEAAGLEYEETDDAVSIRGSQPFPTTVDRGIAKIVEGMKFTPRETDDLRDHVADLSVWSILKRLAD